MQSGYAHRSSDLHIKFLYCLDLINIAMRHTIKPNAATMRSRLKHTIKLKFSQVFKSVSGTYTTGISVDFLIIPLVSLSYCSRYWVSPAVLVEKVLILHTINILDI